LSVVVHGFSVFGTGVRWLSGRQHHPQCPAPGSPGGGLWLWCRLRRPLAGSGAAPPKRSKRQLHPMLQLRCVVRARWISLPCRSPTSG